MDVDGHEWSDDEIRRFATGARDQHDPTKQGDVGFPGRCAHCNFTRHPCDTFDLASIVLALLDRKEG